MVIQRGDLWWASLPEPVSSEPGFRRPVLIIQSDDFNRSRINTVIAVVITSNIRLADAPGNVFLPHQATNLPKDSVANVSQVITLDKSFLTEQIGTLPLKQLHQIEAGLRLVLAL